MQRRTVLRSAVKLAYATPVIAASAKLSDFKDAGASHAGDPECYVADHQLGSGCFYPIIGCTPENPQPPSPVCACWRYDPQLDCLVTIPDCVPTEGEPTIPFCAEAE